MEVKGAKGTIVNSKEANNRGEKTQRTALKRISRTLNKRGKSKKPQDLGFAYQILDKGLGEEGRRRGM